MLSFGTFAFAQPWLLIAALTLPAIWLLLRVTPPAPRRIAFPPFLLLARLISPERTPARTPWWLLLLRLLIAALLIFALAGPVLNPAPRLGGGGPLLLVVDNGWAAAKHWSQRIDLARELLLQAEREGREVMLLETAPDPDERVELKPMTAREASESLAGWQPRPWPVDRAAAREVLGQTPGLEQASSVWLSDGVALGEQGRIEAERLAEALRSLGPLQVRLEPGADLPMVLALGEPTAGGLTAQLTAVPAGVERSGDVAAIGPDGETVAKVPIRLPAGDAAATAGIELPPDLRNRITRVELGPPQGIAGTFLLDERWRRRSVGLVGPPRSSADQPLLAELYFIDRALRPFAEVHEAPLLELLRQPLSLLVMADSGGLDTEERAAVDKWLGEGGVLLRFAGPKLAASTDDLVPVPLRAGDRALGGALSWSEPLALAPFPPDSPFAGLPVAGEARVSRQVLAEPGPDLAEATLASLSDGTPLVTGARRGKGWLILVHTTANTAWTTLPLSGLFVQMLERVLALGPGVSGTDRAPLEPSRLLDAYGRLEEPRITLDAIAPDAFADARPGPRQPPGLYAPVGRQSDADTVARSALNLQRVLGEVVAIGPAAAGGSPEPYARAAERDLAPWLILTALVLAMVDLLIALALRGLLPGRRGLAAGSAAAVLMLALLAGAPAAAQEAGDDAIIELTRDTHLAYVVTGNPDIDGESEAGLKGLTRVLADRTSIEAADPVPVHIASDDLALFPLLYWPVPPDHPDLAPGAVERVESYLAQGGMILFDTRDASLLLPGQEGNGPGERRLAEILRGIDLPPLMPLPADHVLTRSFYLLQDFPGRWTGQPVWVDQAPPGINDGVSGVIVGANEWAGAWAVDET
ncbi:MAG: DUF4159 domain-containing protein, partial [Geminicoccaceae bacterium]